jgi:hypothetical protein
MITNYFGEMISLMVGVYVPFLQLNPLTQEHKSSGIVQEKCIHHDLIVYVGILMISYGGLLQETCLKFDGG